MRNFKFIIGILLLGFLGAGSMEDDDSAKYTNLDYSSPAYRVYYKNLVNEFDNNSIAAENKYEGKLIYVQGPVGSVDKDILDDPYIAIRGEYEFSSVQCMIREESLAAATSLSKGQQVVVGGVVGDTTLGVILRGCRLISR